MIDSELNRVILELFEKDELEVVAGWYHIDYMEQVSDYYVVDYCNKFYQITVINNGYGGEVFNGEVVPEQITTTKWNPV